MNQKNGETVEEAARDVAEAATQSAAITAVAVTVGKVADALVEKMSGRKSEFFTRVVPPTVGVVISGARLLDGVTKQNQSR